MLKEVRNLLKSDGKRGIIKNEWDEELHPRNELGRFAHGDGSSGGNDEDGRGAATFGGATSEEFASAIADAKSTLSPEIAWRVDSATPEDIEKYHKGAKMHITDGGSTVAVDEDGDIWGVCKSADDSVSGMQLIEMAIANGGTKLDSYAGNHGFYVKCKFEPVSYCQWNDLFTPPDWSKDTCKKEEVVFYKYTGKESAYKKVKQFTDSTKASSDYDQAWKDRDESMQK